VNVDPGKVQEVFGNRIENAIKSMDKPNLMIEVHRIVQGRFVHLSFRNNGRGILSEGRERVFLKFSHLGKGAQSRESDSSVGLGLAMTRPIVEVHGRQVQLQSEPEVGSEFAVTLSVWRDDQEAQQ